MERIVTQRKVFKAGNSLVVSLPKGMLELLVLTEGADVSVELDLQNRQMLISPAPASITANLSEDFARQVSEFIE